MICMLFIELPPCSDIRADQVQVVDDLEALRVVPEDGEGVVVDVEAGDEGGAKHRRADREDSAAAAEVRHVPGGKKPD